MIQMKDLNPHIREAIEIATDGLPLMDSARLRGEMIAEIEEAALCGAILPKQVYTIIDGVLVRDMARLRTQLRQLPRE